METEKKLVSIFEKFVEKSEYGELNRTTCSYKIYDENGKFKRQLRSVAEKAPHVILSETSFYRKPGYCLKVVDFVGNEQNAGEEFLQVFPVTVSYTTYLCYYGRHNFPFFKRRRKFNELHKIYSEAGLSKITNLKQFGYIREYTTYAISYGQILRELSRFEYNELESKYLVKLCNLDLEFIESQLKN